MRYIGVSNFGASGRKQSSLSAPVLISLSKLMTYPKPPRAISRKQRNTQISTSTPPNNNISVCVIPIKNNTIQKQGICYFAGCELYFFTVGENVPEASDSKGILRQNHIDTGCDQGIVQKCMELSQKRGNRRNETDSLPTQTDTVGYSSRAGIEA